VNKNTEPVRFQGLYEWMQSIVIVFLIILCLLTFIGRPMGVHGYSMMPTLSEDDRMIIRSIGYTPDRGDVIVFSRHDFEEGAALVKRVIALAGDVVNLDAVAGMVYVNGILQDEPYINDLTRRAGNMSFPFTVPEGHVFVLGDNRNHSTDSRDMTIGAVDEREIIGQVVAVVLPFNRARFSFD